MINGAPWQKQEEQTSPRKDAAMESEGKLCTAPWKPLSWIPSPWGAAKWDNTVGSQIQERSPPHRGAPHLPWMPSQWGGAAEVKEARRRRQRVGPPAPTWGRQPDSTCWIQHLLQNFCFPCFAICTVHGCNLAGLCHLGNPQMQRETNMTNIQT